jgi:predicted secreted protein
MLTLSTPFDKPNRSSSLGDSTVKITVLNGSNKGDQSVTLQYVRFIQKTFPQHELTVVHGAQKI